MYLLGMFYIGIAVLILASLSLLFFVKNNKLNNIIICVIAVFSILIALLSIASMPSNFTAEKIIAFAIGLISVIGCFIRFKFKNYSLAPKFMVTISLVGTFIFMLI